VQFKRAQGYYDAMYGVYATMASTTLYGENLSYGFLDKIGQMFGYLNSVNSDTEILKYDYTDQRVRSVIDNIWTTQYQTISYLNNIIANAEKTPLTDTNLNLVRGEAYGLRAFLHFDLLDTQDVGGFVHGAGTFGIDFVLLLLRLRQHTAVKRQQRQFAAKNVSRLRHGLFLDVGVNNGLDYNAFCVSGCPIIAD